METKKQTFVKVHKNKNSQILDQLSINIPFCENQAEAEYNNREKFMVDENVEVNFLDEKSQIYDSKIFICNRYIFNDHCDAETQAFIPVLTKKIIGTTVKLNDKNVGTDQTYISRSVGPEKEDLKENGFLKCSSGFHGVSSVKSEQEMLSLAGVTIDTYNLLKKIYEVSDGKKISKENRLLIFLCKMKLGLSYSALGVLFAVDRKTISRIFISTLEYLVVRCRNFVTWPSKEVVQATMPNEFREMYENCRVLIDCTEIKIDQASSVEAKVQTYSHYKKGFTIKVLVGCTPSGFVSFVSKSYGGRISDAQITTLSGILDLLEPDDLVLADKGFPGIQSTIDEKGAGIILVMPPFLRGGMFSEEQVEETYQVAKFRIHIERIMQRIRIYNILSKLPMHLLPHADNIIFMCCVLVNLQPPILKENGSEDSKA